jgi:CheY-like chemotaxis protein
MIQQFIMVTKLGTPVPYRILLVEDHPLNVELVRDLLESEGLAVLHSFTAEEALALATHSQPDLLLMDLALPGMDGLEAIRRLKSDPATQDICIVVLTARAMKGDRERALAQGCDAYMTKPLDTRTFARDILALLHARGGPRLWSECQAGGRAERHS